ncbi:sulfite oxidase, partial [Clonorchis sinensis]
WSSSSRIIRAQVDQSIIRFAFWKGNITFVQSTGVVVTAYLGELVGLKSTPDIVQLSCTHGALPLHGRKLWAKQFSPIFNTALPYCSGVGLKLMCAIFDVGYWNVTFGSTAPSSYAFSGGGRGILSVRVSADGGKTWHDAVLSPVSPPAGVDPDDLPPGDLALAHRTHRHFFLKKTVLTIQQQAASEMRLSVTADCTKLPMKMLTERIMFERNVAVKPDFRVTCWTLPSVKTLYAYVIVLQPKDLKLHSTVVPRFLKCVTEERLSLSNYYVRAIFISGENGQEKYIDTVKRRLSQFILSALNHVPRIGRSQLSQFQSPKDNKLKPDIKGNGVITESGWTYLSSLRKRENGQLLTEGGSFDVTAPLTA